MLPRVVVVCALVFPVSSHAEDILLFDSKGLDTWTFDTVYGSDEDEVKKEDFWLVQSGGD